MTRKEMIQKLIDNAIINSPEVLSRVSEEGKNDLVNEYRKHLEKKSDLEIKNIFLINFL